MPGGFVAVTNITGVPTTATSGTPLSLSGTAEPAGAPNKTTTRSLQSAGTTGATVSGNTFNATAAGTAVITATVENGATAATDYTKDFNITVAAAVIGAPGITGPTAISLTTGYAATSTGAYTVTGDPAPEVTKASGNGKIIWNDSTKKLDIAAGLTAGKYEAILKASSTGKPDATLTFTLTVSDAAAATGPMSNFTKTKSYTSGMFSDVNENQWYGYNQQKVIANAYEYGLMQGSGNTFSPGGNMTLAEAVTIAARVHDIYSGGNGEFTQGSPWYQVYVDYAISKGIINIGAFTDFNKGASRAEMAFIFASALPESEFTSQNTVNSLPDVNSGTSYYSSILLLYKAGVVAGNDSGAFNPASNVTRAEAAAIISRVILPASRFSGKVF
jgi:hypothetical protein